MATYEKVNKLEELKKRLQPMTWKERFSYLWEYYKWVAIIAVAVIAMTVSIVSSVIENSKEVLYNGLSVNISLTEEGTSYLSEDWYAKLQGNPKRNRVDFTPLYINTNNSSYSETAMVNANKLLAMITAGEVDYLVMDAYSLQYCGGSGAFAPLESVVSQDILDQFEGKLVTFQEEDREYLAAIDISDLPFVKAHLTSADKVYIAFPGNTGRSARNEAFLRYLMDWTA